MRWSIRLQFLLPVLLVVLVAIIGHSLLSAEVISDWVQRRQEENLARVVKTLTDASFPLDESVLSKMSGLSGADFVLFDAEGNTRAASRKFSADDLAALRQLPRATTLANFAAAGALTLDGKLYLAARLTALDRASADSPPLSLAVLYPEERWSAARQQATYLPLVVGAAAVLVAAVVATLVARRVVMPLESLRRQAAAIEQGDFRPMPVGNRNDEIQDLTRSINHMVERLARYEADVRQNERLRTLGQLGAGIAHQMRNAATGARLALDLHRRACPPLADLQSLDVAARQLTLMETYLQRFMTLGRQDPLEIKRLDLAALVGEVTPLVQPACDHAGIKLEVPQAAEPLWIDGDGPEQARGQRPEARGSAKPLWIDGDGQAITHLLVNLLLNAVEAASAGGKGRVVVETSRESDGRILCRVCDTGPGPSAEIAARLFEPFATDKPEGVGLGLAVARQIAQQHRAELSWDRSAGMTRFTIAFPATRTGTGA